MKSRSVMDYDFPGKDIKPKRPFGFIRILAPSQKPKGYTEIEADCCLTCRFCLSDPEGCFYCKLYIETIDFNFGMVHFIMVDELGKCVHYKRVKMESE